MTGRPALVRVGAIAALLGGLAWVVKGVAILVTGDQPPIVFALGPPLFAVGLIGLRARIGERGGRAATAGVALAYLALALSLAVAVAALVARDLLPEGEEFAPFSLVVATTPLAILVALVLLGIAARRAGTFARPWAALPLAMGVLAIPALFVGGLLSAINERLLEVPLVLLGLAWVALGYLIWPGAARRAA